MTLLFYLCFMVFGDSLVLVDFSKSNALDDWYVVDDGVMGGLSQGSLLINKEDHAVFSGQISLDNYGGFSSVRHVLSPTDCTPYSKIVLSVKGDGKKYQFRIKSNRSDYYSYIQYFETTGDWELIELNLADFYPSFRGRTLKSPNFSGGPIEELGILFGNKKVESFELELATISLK